MTTKRQHANLWGQSVGQLNQKVIDFTCEAGNSDHGSVELTVEQKGTTKINSIPDHVEIHLIVRNRLRIQRFSCGTRGTPTALLIQFLKQMSLIHSPEMKTSTAVPNGS